MKPITGKWLVDNTPSKFYYNSGFPESSGIILTAKDLNELAERINKERKTKIICLCGSTRFTYEMLIKQWELTKQGIVVLSWCALPDDYFQGENKTHIGDQEGVKEIVDEVHKRKIDLSDEVLVMNIGGYIGESTRSEIEYAHSIGVSVRYLEGQDGQEKE